MNFLNDLASNNQVVIADDNRSLTGQQFAEAVTHVANELLQKHFVKGTPVLLRMTNSVPSTVMFFALVRAGATVFVGNPHDPVNRVIESIERFGLGAVFADVPTTVTVQAKLLGELGESVLTYHYEDTFSALSLPANNRPLASVDASMASAQVAIFSSGTTGRPKAILHSIDNLLHNAKLHAEAVGLRATDVVAGFLPVYYSYGLVANLMASLVSNSKMVFKLRGTNLDQQWANDNKVTTLALTPFFAQQQEFDIPSLRLMTFGGDALSADAALKLKRKLPDCELYSTYGLTECGPRVATWRFDNKIIPDGFIVPLGKPLPGFTLVLSEDTGHGELLVTTPTRTLGYYHGLQEGYEMPDWGASQVHTGDLFFAVDGQYHFASRDKHMIVQNGEKLFPPLIEAIIRKIDGVVDVSVEGILDRKKGQVARANIHASIELTTRVIRKTLLQQLPHSAIPEQFEFVNKIPRSQTGKQLGAVS